MIKLLHKQHTPLLIAGPCSAETFEQLHAVTAALTESGRVDLIRLGVWKPRTHPGGFEGMGEEALRWVAQLRREYPAARFCCEVACPAHVEMAQRYGIDAFWIGSRTAGNPFSMSELCAALQGSEYPVLIKNPMTPDVQLWMGALERVSSAGVKHIAAVHRGFSLFNNGNYRNNPLWEIPMELKRLMPNIPLICDPSHIGGNRHKVLPLMQTAMDLHFDGLMVEVHPCPSKALTDSCQQLTPQDFLHYIDRLTLHYDNNATPAELTLLRKQLDNLDEQLLATLSQRMEVSRQIAHIKQNNNLAIYQPQRWKQVLSSRLIIARKLGLDEVFVKRLYEKIHAESVRIQEAQMNAPQEAQHGDSNTDDTPQHKA